MRRLEPIRQLLTNDHLTEVTSMYKLMRSTSIRTQLMAFFVHFKIASKTATIKANILAWMGKLLRNENYQYLKIKMLFSCFTYFDFN